MPELPEVETIKNQLLRKIKGKTIKNIKTKDYQKNIQGRLNNLLAKIINIQRTAKLLVFSLSNNYSFLIHLKLTGQLIYFSKPPPEIKKSTHVVFVFQDGSQLFFNDFRKFGFLKIMKTDELKEYFQKQSYGPDPLKITYPQFKQLLRKKSKSKIKPTLMDQKVIAGIGNIYSQEACFKAGILPARLISSLTEAEIKKLYLALKSILKSAIQQQGTSFDLTYRTIEDKPGGYDRYLKVYHQDKCAKCGSELKVIRLNGRSTYYCPKCQK